MRPSAYAPVIRRPGLPGKPQQRAIVVPCSPAEKLTMLGKIAYLSLCLLVFAIPWEDAITIPGFGTSARLIGVITVVFGLMAIIEKGAIKRPAPGHFMLGLFVISAAATYLWSLYPEGTVTQTVTYLQLLVLAWLIWELCPNDWAQQGLMRAYVLGTYVSGLDTIFRFLSHQESAYQRYAGSGLDANDLGLMMALSIPISYYLLIQEKGSMVWIYRLQLVVAVTTILLTASRGATLACLVALAIVPITHARLTIRKKVALLLTLVLLISGVMIFVPETSWERLSTVPDEFEHGTFTGRTVIWKAGWQIFREHPFLGIGTNAFRVIVSRELAEPIHLDDPTSPAPPAHNTFLSVLVEQGILGFAVFTALLFVLGFSVAGLPPFPQKLWIVVLLVWAVGVSSLTWEMRKPTWFFFGLLIAQCATLEQKRVPLRKAVPFAAQPSSSISRLSWS